LCGLVTDKRKYLRTRRAGPPYYPEHFHRPRQNIWNVDESHTEGVPALAAYLADTPSTVPERAMRVLRKAQPPANEVIPALRAALEDERPRVRREARRTLDFFQPAAKDAVNPASRILDRQDR
jgi:hypothetical protein